MNTNCNHPFSLRSFRNVTKGLALLLMAAFCLFPFTAASAKKGSKFGGVQVGTITYSYRSMPDQSLEAMLQYAVESGLSSVELMGGPVEQYAGIPRNRSEISAWRSTVSMDKFKEVRDLFKKKGIKIDILKLGESSWSDAEIDYAFNVCRALGARGITMEISEASAKRMQPFAEKHKLYVIFHNHGQPGDPNFSFDKVLEYGPNIMLNFDAGHYFGATGKHPNELIERLHNRIASIHIKDKTGPKASPPDRNQPFGQGETPVGEILRLVQKNKWPITCDIELEYNVPTDSDAVKEVKKCVEFCRNELTGKGK